MKGDAEKSNGLGEGAEVEVSGVIQEKDDETEEREVHRMNNTKDKNK